MIDDIVAAVLEVTRGSAKLHPPSITQEDVLQVVECASGNVVSHDAIHAFERELERITGATHALALASGTAALHVALMAIGVRPGDEVLCPALTFVATANAICHAGAIPHFVDAQSTTLGVNPFKLRQYLAGLVEAGTRGPVNKTTRRTISAFVPTHLLGHPCEIDELTKLAASWGLPVVEDAAEALGATVGNRGAGTFGRAGILSFNNNKIVTTGGGGALLTDDAWLAARVYQLATTAKVAHPWRWEHSEVGWNYRMPNICAALGVDQLRRLDRTIARKKEIHHRYMAAFDGLHDIATVIPAPPFGTSNYWLNSILIDPRRADRTEEILSVLHAEGIEARAGFRPMHLLPMFRDFPRSNVAVAEDLAKRLICLPSNF